MLFLLRLLTITMALLGAPLFVVIGALALLAFHSIGVDLSVVTIEMSRLADTPVLLSLPLFIFAGTLLSESGTPRRMLALSDALLGWMPGGLAVIALLVCAVFTAFTGASGITIIAMGGLLFPALLKDGYPERFSLGLITTSGSLGLLFPPSLPLIIYGVIAEVSIDKLFLAGIIPGIVMLLLLSSYCLVISRTTKRKAYRFSFAQIFKAMREAAWEIPLPFLVLGGIYGGFFVASEAAAVTALYVLIVEVLIYRDIDLGNLRRVMVRSMVLFGGILMILAVARASTNFLVDQEVPTKLFELIKDRVTSKYTFLLILNLFLLVVGVMMDIFSALILVVPLILPIASHYGIDPIHLGIIFLTNLQIGYSMPPMGMDLFLASYCFKKPVLVLYRACLPFLAILLVTLALNTYFPVLSLWLIGWRG